MMTMEQETLYTSLKQWIPTVPCKDARVFIKDNVSVLNSVGKETFFELCEMYCAETSETNDWLVLKETLDDCENYECDIEKAPEKLVFVWFKFVQKSVEQECAVGV